MSDFPDAFIQRIKHQWEDAADLLLALNQESPVSILRHPSKTPPQLAGEPVPWNPAGTYLEERPSFTLDPLYHAGSYYPQEASSMVIQGVLEELYPEDRKISVLDLCAAPGGKSLNILNFLNGDGLLVSNEVIKSRNLVLVDNLNRWGFTNVIVTNNDPGHFSSCRDEFDVVLVDAPCSGEGMFRKDPKAIEHWSPEHVEHCALRQSRILDDAAVLIAPGGYLIYSTCTFAPQENTAQVERLRKQGFVSVSTEVAPAETEVSKGCYSFLPHRTRGEGFFLAILQKSGERQTPRVSAHGSKLELPPGILPFDGQVHMQGDWYHGMSNSAYSWLMGHSGLRYTKSGVELGKVIRGELIPSHSLALSHELGTALPSIDVDRATGLEFLRKASIRLDAPIGWHKLTYKDEGIGWVKVLSNRVNNYLPAALRIKHL